MLMVVEGQSDRNTLPAMARKIIGHRVGFDTCLMRQGDMFNPVKLEVHIKVALRRNTGRVLVGRDSECTEVAETRQRLEAVVQQIAGRFPNLLVKAVVVDHSLESWFLQDRITLAQFLGIAVSRLKYTNPENQCRPAELMSRMFRLAKRDFIKTESLPGLVERINPETIAQRSPTFCDFQSALTSDH
jgi:hypothetical protein